MGTLCRSGPQVTTTNSNTSGTTAATTNANTAQNTTQQQSYAPNAAVVGAGTEAIDMARTAADQPFSMPAAPVAQFSPFQQQSFNQIQGMQGGISPYFDAARAQATNAGAPVTGSDINQYVNPYADATLANMKKYIFDPQRVSTMGRDTQLAGGVGADRLALTSQNLDKTQGDAIAQAMAGFYQPAMNMAQAQKQQALQTAQGWANLGMSNLSGNLQQTGALMGAGNQQQAQTQAELMSPYQQALAKLAYPYQNAQFLAGITGGLAPSMGGTTSGYSGTTGNTTGATTGNTTGTSAGTSTMQAATPSPLNQILGIGTAAAGMFGGLGGFSSLFGGGGGGSMSGPGGSNPFMPSGLPNYTAYPYAGQNRGGAVNRAAGGSVNPWDYARGFDIGGSPNEEVERRFSGSSYYTPDETSIPYQPPVSPEPSNPFAGIDTSGGTGFRSPEVAPQGSASYARVVPPPPPVQVVKEGDFNSIDAAAPPMRPQVTVNPRPAPRAEAPPIRPALPPRAAPDPSINGDTTMEGQFMPRERQPYPDATDRDWGQKLTRSPWMSLVAAGAKMAQHVGPVGAAIGAGAQAGVGHLGEQRKELRNEEQINQKADALYQHAKAELDKYTKMTPYQQGVLDTSKFINTGMTTENGHPVLFNQKSGASVNGITGQPIDPNEKLTGGKGGKPVVFEIKRKAYLALHPGDEEGANNFANGKTMLSHGQLASMALMRAQQDAAGDAMLFSQAKKEEYIKRRTQEHLEYLTRHNTMTSPSIGATPGP